MSVKGLDYYMNLTYEVDIKKRERSGGYLVSLPELNGCRTVAKNIADAMDRIQEVKKDWLIEAIKKKDYIPEPDYAIE